MRRKMADESPQDSYILKLREKAKQRKKSHYSRLDLRKNIGKRTGKVCIVGGISDISGLFKSFDSSGSSDLNISKDSVTKSHLSTTIKRTLKPASPPEFCSDSNESEDSDLPIATHEIQNNHKSDSDDDGSFAKKTNGFDKSVNTKLSDRSQLFSKSYVNQSTQYSSPRRAHTTKATSQNSSQKAISIRAFSENKAPGSPHASDLEGSKKTEHRTRRSSAGECNVSSLTPKAESQRIMDKILSSAKNRSKSHGFSHRQKNLFRSQSASKRISDDESHTTGASSSSGRKSNILDVYTKMITSPAILKSNGIDPEVSLSGSVVKRMGSLTPRQSSQQSILRRRLSFKDGQNASISEPTVNSSRNEVSTSHPFEMDKNSSDGLNEILIQESRDVPELTPSWLLTSRNTTNEHHPSLLKRRKSSGKEKTSEQSIRGRSRKKTTGENIESNKSTRMSKSGTRSNETSQSPQRAGRRRSKQRLTFTDTDDNATEQSQQKSVTERIPTSQSPQHAGRRSSKQRLTFTDTDDNATEQSQQKSVTKRIPSSKKRFSFRSRIESGDAVETSEIGIRKKPGKSSSRKSHKLTKAFSNLVDYSTSDDSDTDQRSKSVKKHSPLKSIQNRLKIATARNMNQRESDSDEETVNERHSRISKSGRKSHVLYQSLVEKDILRKMENVEKIRSDMIRSVTKRASSDRQDKSQRRSNDKDAGNTFAENKTISIQKRNSVRKSRKGKESKVRKSSKKNSATKSVNDVENIQSVANSARNIAESYQDYAVDDHIQSSTKKRRNTSLIYSDSDSSFSNREDFVTKVIRKSSATKRKINREKEKLPEQELTDRDSDLSPTKRQKIETDRLTSKNSMLKNKNKKKIDESLSLHTWLESAGSAHNENSPVRLPIPNSFKLPLTHSTRIEKRCQKVHTNAANTEESYADTDQTDDHHPPLPRVNESSINYTNDDLRPTTSPSKSRNSIRQFGPPASTPRGLKRVMRHTGAKDVPQIHLPDLTQHNSVASFVGVDGLSQEKGFQINSCSENDSRVSDDTYTELPAKDDRKSTKSAKKKTQSNIVLSHGVYDEVEIEQPDNPEPISFVDEIQTSRERSRSRSRSRSSNRDRSSKQKNSRAKMRSISRSTERLIQNETAGSEKITSKAREKNQEKRGLPKKNVSKEKTKSLKDKTITQGAKKTKDDDEKTLLASDNDKTLTPGMKKKPKKQKALSKKKTVTRFDIRSLALDIIIPNGDADGLRRSRRVRTRPLGYGERLEYDEHFNNIIGVKRRNEFIAIDVNDTGKIIHVESTLNTTVATRMEIAVERKERSKPKRGNSKSLKQTNKKKKVPPSHDDQSGGIVTSNIDANDAEMVWFDRMSNGGNVLETSNALRCDSSQQHITRNTTLDSSLLSGNKTIEIVDASTDSIIQVDLSSIFCHDDGLFGSAGVPVYDEKGVWVTKGISHNGVAQGKMVIQPLRHKDERVVNNAHMCFFLQRGTVDITLAGSTLNLREGTYFRVPCKNRYSLYNPHKNLAANLSFTMVRIAETKKAA